MPIKGMLGNHVMQIKGFEKIDSSFIGFGCLCVKRFQAPYLKLLKLNQIKLRRYKLNIRHKSCSCMS